MNFRLFSAADYAAWLPLWQGYLQNIEPQSASLIAHIWGEIVAGRILGFGVFADDGRLPGFAHCVIHAGTSSAAPCCYLEDLFVAADARRQGVARFLLRELFAYARQAGYYKIYWITGETNQAAQALYREFAPQVPYVMFKCCLQESP